MKLTRYASATEIELKDGTIVLVSYSTPVAAFIPGERGVIAADRKYSRTTSKHIARFMLRNNFTTVREATPEAIAALLEGEGK